MDDICNQYLDYLRNKCNKCYNFLLFSNRHLTVNMLIKLEISVPGMTHNGLAVGLSKRYPTQHPGRILVPRASGAGKLSWCKAHLR